MSDIREGAWFILRLTKFIEFLFLVALTGCMIGATLQLIANDIEPKVWGPALLCCVIAVYHTAYTLVLNNFRALIKRRWGPLCNCIINCIDLTLLCKPTKVVPYLCEEKLEKGFTVKWLTSWAIFTVALYLSWKDQRESPDLYERDEYEDKMLNLNSLLLIYMI
jgi:hypothetical protein